MSLQPTSSKPVYTFENIPDYFRERAQWVCWKYETRDAKPTKVPYQWNGSAASSTDAATWTTFDVACLAFNAPVSTFDGIGYMAADDEGLVMFDFDHVIDAAGALNPIAAEMMKSLDSYAEKTPSGSGLHVYAFGSKPGTRCKTTVAKGTENEFVFEMYEKARYLTFTGWHWDWTPMTVEQREAEIAALYSRVFTPEPKEQNGGTKLRELKGTRGGKLSNEDVLAKCRKAANGAKFTALYGGDTTQYQDASAADFALIGMLRFYTQDADQLEQLMEGSKLVREKWDERRGEGTYLTYSIENALKGDYEAYRGSAPSEPVGPAGGATTTEDAAPRPLIQFRRGSELDDRPLEYLVEDMLPAGMLAALSGKDGLGKTLLAKEIMRAVLTGLPFLGRFQVKRGKVFGIFLDDPEFLVRQRLQEMSILDHEDLRLATENDVDKSNPQKLLEAIGERLVVERPALIVVDALYHFIPSGGNGDQANSVSAMGPVVEAFNQISRVTGATTLMVCHDNKAGSDVAGSYAVRAGLKAVLRLLLPPEGEQARTLGEATPPERILQLNKLKTGRPASWRVRLDGPGRWEMIGTSTEARQIGLRERILADLEDNGASTVVEVKKRLRAREEEVRRVCKKLYLTGELTQTSEQKGALRYAVKPSTQPTSP